MTKLRDEVIGKRVRQARLEFCFSQEELGTGVGLTRSQIANIEAGRTVLSLKDAEEICNFLGLELTDLTDVNQSELDALILFRQVGFSSEEQSDDNLIDWSESILKELLSQEKLYNKQREV
ncbi:transcriptional regulator with XRE-family HTH domain [Bacillus sp. RC240]|uniref:helix-turn-helix domain-containing protein n=1 Tax=Bacillus sp. RC240 TaxID=3156285 RepID=UPI0038356104